MILSLCVSEGLTLCETHVSSWLILPVTKRNIAKPDRLRSVTAGLLRCVLSMQPSVDALRGFKNVALWLPGRSTFIIRASIAVLSNVLMYSGTIH
jgi:hypothetical protein